MCRPKRGKLLTKGQRAVLAKHCLDGAGLLSHPVVGELDDSARADVVRTFVVSGADDSSPDYEDIVDLLSSRTIDFDVRRSPRRFVYVEDIMVREVKTTTPDAPIVEAARVMVRNHIHRLPVMEDGRLVGILTTFDLMRHLAGADGD